MYIGISWLVVAKEGLLKMEVVTKRFEREDGILEKVFKDPCIKGGTCHNFNLGLTTKARACKVACQKRKHGSGRKCEGMNLHTPKGTSTLGVRVPVDSRMFKERLQGPKFNGLRSYIYHWKFIET
jgi:hypothetical protein